jgi:coenzyme F420-reducing hydrogenase gamma subunit
MIALCMGIAGVKWKCPSCNIDVGGSMGELKNHIKNVHGHIITKKEEK